MTEVSAVVRLDDGVALLDTQHAGRHGTIGAYLVPQAGAAGRAGRFDLVESGPLIDLGALEGALRSLGLEPAGVERVLVTHVHLDHAGAAGAWALRHGARVVALSAGAKHLLDPSRLLASAERVYGDALERMWGGMIPLPAESLQAVEDGDEIPVGGRRVRVVATPGHARHHAAFVWPDGIVYTGDSAGVRFPGWPVVRPALPPPELDLAAWDATFRRLQALEPEQLRLTHFGPFDDVEHHLSAAQRGVHAWSAALLGWAQEGCSRAEAARRFDELAREELAAAGADESTVQRYLATSDAEMTVAGVERYWSKHHPELWPGLRGEDG